MCGKFTQLASWRDLHAFSQPLTAAAEDEPVVFATPMRPAQILRLDSEGRRELVEMRWGFSDRRAAAPTKPKHMHVRAETIDERATFAPAFAHARGLLLVHTFNVGEDLPSGRTKQWVITPRDGRPLGIAVLWEAWARADAPEGDETLLTFVMVTTPPNALIATVTDRMPAILPPETWATWLGETDASDAEVKALLETYDDAGGWEMAPQSPPKPPKARDGGGQGELF